MKKCLMQFNVVKCNYVLYVLYKFLILFSSIVWFAYWQVYTVACGRRY